MDILDTCRNATGRTYPPGYGFALRYLWKAESAGPDHLKAMQDSAWRAVKGQAKRGNPDAAAFVSAYAESRETTPAGGWQFWLIEAAQLVLAEALLGRAHARRTLALWGHPGYEREAA